MATTDIFLAMSKDGFGIDDNSKGDGDAKFGTGDVRCPGAIEVLSFSHSVEQHGVEDGGRPRSVEHVEHGPFVIKKAIDAFTPYLFRMCAGGSYISEAKLLLYSAGKGGKEWTPKNPASDGFSNIPQPFLVYTLSYVHVSFIRPSGGDGIPTEEIGLKYGQLKVKHTEGNHERDWSLVMEAPVKLHSGSGAGDAKTSTS